MRGRGQALVEFALVIPLFVLLMVAIFDLGRGVFAYNSITNAAREGARLAIVNQTDSSVVARAISQAAIAETAAPNVTVAYRETGPNADFALNGNCTPLKVDCVAIVTFETTFRPVTPIISNLLFGSGVTLTAKSIEAIEFICPNSTTTSSNCPKQP